ncbi:DsbE family thiol:disulfide interchange protein [Halovulum marinum]|uniref:DsbE family thiol:disulfide interchange protein n=1 Tax=Halovulum marinum TaxID=2662447 RepID=UPI001F40B25D|nr:DsbE family thiol:disulfide interchange protein [Halovulum marinum]
MLIPPVLFLAFAGVLLMGLWREAPDELPSALAGRTAPALELPPLDGLGVPAPGPDALTADGIKLVNFWASWCGPCRAEHPTLEAMAEAGVPIIGVNYKDQPEDALGFLRELGNPFTAVGVDAAGRAGIDWGIYGLPETFVIDADGKVLLRHPGPITRAVYETRFQPLLGVALD